MGNFGIKVSKEGVAVKDALPHQLVFSSKYQYLVLHAEGTVTQVVTTTPLTVTHEVAHNLGYPPLFIFRVIVPASVSGYGVEVAYDQYLDTPLTQRTYVDNNKLYIECTYNSAGTWKHKYQIYKNRL